MSPPPASLGRGSGSCGHIVLYLVYTAAAGFARGHYEDFQQTQLDIGAHGQRILRLFRISRPRVALLLPQMRKMEKQEVLVKVVM